MYSIYTLSRDFLSLLGRAQSLRLDERHPMCPHVSVQVALRFKLLAAHFAPGAHGPVVVLHRDVQLVFPLALVVVVLPPSVVAAEALRLLQSMDDEEVAGLRAVGGVAEAALLTLEGRAVGLVLGNVLVESGDVLGGEAADGALVNFEDVHLQPLERLRVGASQVEPRRPHVLFCFPLGVDGLRGRLQRQIRSIRRISPETFNSRAQPYRRLVR